jgi:flagellar biosynthesis protein FliQ
MNVPGFNELLVILLALAGPLVVVGILVGIVVLLRRGSSTRP